MRKYQNLTFRGRRVVNGSLKTTFETLQKSGNEAAVAVLTTALDSQHWPIQEAALRAILGRRSPAAHRQLVQKWDRLPDRMREIIAERPGRLTGATRDAILSTNEAHCHNGCDAVLGLREYDLLPALATAAEDDANPLRDLAGKTLLELTQLLYGDLTQGTKRHPHRDVHIVRQQAMAALAASVDRYTKHRRRDILEAFLLIAGRDNTTLKRILHNPHDSRFLTTIDLLAGSEHPGVLRLLLSFLEDKHAPSSVLGIVSRRRDEAFVRRLLAKIGYEPSSAAKHNIRRIKSIQWLADDLTFLDDFDDAEQHSIVQLVTASGVSRLESFEVIQYLLRRGKVGGRRAASQALAEFHGVDANQLLSEALHDEDPQVQANLLCQLRERGIPGAMSNLLQMIDSAHEVVRCAARKCLAEFTIRRFLAAYDVLEENVRRSTGRLVRKVDPQTVPTLAGELRSSARTRRLRALGAAAAVEAVPELEDDIVTLLREDDHIIRAEAASALAASHSDLAVQALRAALSDRSFTVQQAAQQSLERLAGGTDSQETPSLTGTVGVPAELYFPAQETQS